ncbi:hypothetical protein [Nisaea sp.]|uniref:hypothetical protein n=1 Tax=Nisaea sp. TaxID=2024842 RepID=UPI00329A39F4
MGADTDKHAAFVRIGRLIRIWAALRGPKRRRDLDPVVIGPELLPHLCLGHYLDKGTDFRYDLIGSEVSKLAPRLKRGSLASDTMRIQNTDHDHILALFLEAGLEKRPKILEVRYSSIDDVPLRIFAALLPLGVHQDKHCAEDLLLGVWRTTVTGVIAKDNSTDLTGEFLQFSGMSV